MRRHLLVTNDFPPKVGGIQNYLWELWRRLPPEEFVVLTSPYPNSADFDRLAPFEIVRTPEPVLLPHPPMVRRVRELAKSSGAELVVLDPALPLGLIGPKLGLPYALVLHGAEVTVPARLPGLSQVLRWVLAGAALVISAGGYPASEARRVLPQMGAQVVVVPPGVDTERFVPASGSERPSLRARFGLPEQAKVALSVSRLVPRKGMDVFIEALARLRGAHPDLVGVIAGSGRDARRLERLAASTGAPVRLLGRVPEADLPALYASADLFALCCRNRWAGLEQEGFGIVLLEAASAGLACVAGDSGGAPEAVEDGKTGLVVRQPRSVEAVASALGRLVSDPAAAEAMGRAGRARAESAFSYELLAARLEDALRA